jgi:arabinogalactan oligomer/maltooligosaccharide transport system permease protein
MTTLEPLPETAELGQRRPEHDRERGRLRRSFDRSWYAWAMVLPTVAVLGVLVLFP